MGAFTLFTLFVILVIFGGDDDGNDDGHQFWNDSDDLFF